MSFSIAANGQSVVLADEPPYCHSAVTPELRRELKQGLWLVMFVACWSAPDLGCISSALKAAKRFNGAVSFLVLLFDDHREILTLFPDAREKYQSPVWLFLNDGELVEEKTLPHAEEEIASMIVHYLIITQEKPAPDPEGA
jgi:hypothetical protein